MNRPTPAAAPAAGAHAPPGRTAARRRPVSTALLATSAILLVVVLIVGADLLARAGAQTLLARQIQDATGTTSSPSIDAHGSWFLPQAIRGNYGSVDVDLVGLTSGPLTISTLHATLTGVHLPFHDVLVRKVDRIVIDSAVEEAFLTYDDLNGYLEATGRRVRVEPAGVGVVTLSGTVEILGKSITASADALIGSEGGALSLKPLRLHTDTVLDQASEILLGQRFTVLVPLDPLPFGQQITGIDAQDTGFLVQAAGRNVVVDP